MKLIGQELPEDIDNEGAEGQTSGGADRHDRAPQGALDIVSDGERVRLDKTGNAGMTVGGTGMSWQGCARGFWPRGWTRSWRPGSPHTRAGRPETWPSRRTAMVFWPPMWWMRCLGCFLAPLIGSYRHHWDGIGMRVAFLSDVHANLPALRAVLAELDRLGVDRIFHAGDIVGYYPFPDEIIREFQAHGIITILGNHDRAALHANASGMNPMASTAARWTARHLDDNSLKFLRSLRPDLNVLSAHFAPACSMAAPVAMTSTSMSSRRTRDLSTGADADYWCWATPTSPMWRGRPGGPSSTQGRWDSPGMAMRGRATWSSTRPRMCSSTAASNMTSPRWRRRYFGRGCRTSCPFASGRGNEIAAHTFA